MVRLTIGALPLRIIARFRLVDRLIIHVFPFKRWVVL
jgi:hypothetical protein